MNTLTDKKQIRALIFLCASQVEGFSSFSLPYALLTALLINIICAVVHGR